MNKKMKRFVILAYWCYEHQDFFDSIHASFDTLEEATEYCEEKSELSDGGYLTEIIDISEWVQAKKYHCEM